MADFFLTCRICMSPVHLVLQAVGNWGLRLAVYSLLMLGGSIMCIIAIWA